MSPGRTGIGASREEGASFQAQEDGWSNRDPVVSSSTTADPFPPSWQRMLALSGAVFAVLFLVGFVISGIDTPAYEASDQTWKSWATDNESNSGLSVLLTLLAGFAFVHFAGSLRTTFGIAEKAARGFKQLTHVIYVGGIVGIIGIVMAITMIGVAAAEGDATNAVVARATIQAGAGPFLLASVGFAAMLSAAGLLTLRTGAFARWTGIVALIGAIGFLLTFLTVFGDSNESAFGIGYPIGFLALIIWSVGISIQTSRRVGRDASDQGASRGSPTG